jgi:hypothetical protein
MKTLLIGTMALSALASAAAAQPAAERQCFASRQIANSRIVDDSTINFAVGADIYQAKIAGPCPGLSASQRGYTLTFQGSDQICSALDLKIGVNDLGGGHCIAQSLRKLTPVEVAALPAEDKP